MNMASELADDFSQGYTDGLEEFHEEVGEDEYKVNYMNLGASPSYVPGRRFYIMYHGTTHDIALKIKAGGFIPSTGGMLGAGVYLSRDINKASRYPLSNRTVPLAILKVKARVGKVKKIDYQGHPLQTTWHQHGYDTAWVPPNCGMVASGLEEDCVYEPWRIQVLDILPNNNP